MKRSEMERLIVNYLVNKPAYEIYPHEILKVIEDAGMLPPMIYRERPPNATGYYPTWVNMWEEETGTRV